MFCGVCYYISDKVVDGWVVDDDIEYLVMLKYFILILINVLILY